MPVNVLQHVFLEPMSRSETLGTVIGELDRTLFVFPCKKLQGLRSMDLVLTALGVDPVFKTPLPPIHAATPAPPPI
jgi:hypothetical protein